MLCNCNPKGHIPCAPNECSKIVEDLKAENARLMALVAASKTIAPRHKPGYREIDN